MLAALPNLRVISSFGVGLDKLDLDTARAREASRWATRRTCSMTAWRTRRSPC